MNKWLQVLIFQFFFNEIDGGKKIHASNVTVWTSICQNGTFVVADSSLGIQIKYDSLHIAFILLLNATKVQSLWGDINGHEDDDLKKPEDEAVNATNYGWRWRVLQLEGQCAEGCGDASSVALLNS